MPRIGRRCANIVDATSVHVAITRARKDATVYTDSRASLTEALGSRNGVQVGAVDETTNFETKFGFGSPLPHFH